MSAEHPAPSPAELAAFVRATTGRPLRADDVPSRWIEALREWRIHHRRISDNWHQSSPDNKRLTFADAKRLLSVGERTLRKYWIASSFSWMRLRDEDELNLSDVQLSKKHWADIKARGFYEWEMGELRAEKERQKRAKSVPGGRAAAAKRGLSKKKTRRSAR